MAPLSEILGREMETIGSGENRNAIYNSFENHFSFSKTLSARKAMYHKSNRRNVPFFFFFFFFIKTFPYES